MWLTLIILAWVMAVTMVMTTTTATPLPPESSAMAAILPLIQAFWWAIIIITTTITTPLIITLQVAHAITALFSTALITFIPIPAIATSIAIS